MIELTTEQGQALGEAPGPVLVVDPATKREFVLITADVFARLQALGNVDPRDAGADNLPEDAELESSTQAVQRLLFDAGVLSEIKPPITDFTAYDNRQAVTTQGEPISQTIIRERR